MEQPVFAFTKTLQMGMGEALHRMISVHALITAGVASKEQREEFKMIIEALNQNKIDLGFDCNLDGVPDTVEIFAKSVQTSCCKPQRLHVSSRKPPAFGKEKKEKKEKKPMKRPRSSSRRKK